jgi:hypothetical protein
MTEWSIQGEEIVNCNCNFGCPCQFSVLPTDGVCEAAIIYNFEKGHFGDVNLDGLRAAATYKWPGPIHEGNGEMQLIIDEGADDAQRAALQSIMTGGDTDEMATVWFVYSKMAPNKHPTLYEKISYDSDIENRQAKGSASGVVEVSVKPIPHIVHGKPHRARINIPTGFEFDVAEIASGSTTTSGGAITLAKNTDTHAHLAKLNFTGHGAIH